MGITSEHHIDGVMDLHTIRDIFFKNDKGEVVDVHNLRIRHRHATETTPFIVSAGKGFDCDGYYDFDAEGKNEHDLFYIKFKELKIDGQLVKANDLADKDKVKNRITLEAQINALVPDSVVGKFAYSDVNVSQQHHGCRYIHRKS